MVPTQTGDERGVLAPAIEIADNLKLAASADEEVESLIKATGKCGLDCGVSKCPAMDSSRTSIMRRRGRLRQRSRGVLPSPRRHQMRARSIVLCGRNFNKWIVFEDLSCNRTFWLS